MAEDLIDEKRMDRMFEMAEHIDTFSRLIKKESDASTLVCGAYLLLLGDVVGRSKDADKLNDNIANAKSALEVAARSAFTRYQLDKAAKTSAPSEEGVPKTPQPNG